jgi:V/A-type H+-transporting ATPase subunit I
VVHLAPIDPAKAVADERTTAAIDRLRRAIQVLGETEPAGDKPDLAPDRAAAEVLRIQRSAAERRSRLAGLHRQIDQLALWGDVRLEQIAQLRDSGVALRFFSVPAEDAGAVQADCVEPIGEPAGGRVLLALIARGGEPQLPEGAEEVPPPARDRPSLRADAAEIDASLKADAGRLEALAHVVDEMQAERDRLRERAAFTVADRGGLADEALFAVQGWVPADRADGLADGLAAAGVDAGVRMVELAEDDQPPTLVRYPRWVRPIQGLFDILGTFPAYEEHDLSAFFMVALPVFAAMIIGDAGYGLVFLLLPLLLYRRMVRAAGRPKTHLLITIGAVTILWGVLTANYFGVTPADLMRWGGFASLEEMRRGSGFYAALGNTFRAPAVLWDPEPTQARFLLIKVSFLLGCVHLVLAHVRQAVGYAPNAKALSEAGWCLVLIGMLAVIWNLFQFPIPPWALWTGIGMLGAGYVLAVLFAYPQYRLAKRLGVGFAASLLPLIGTFGDTMSYIRLMAVGLASYYIASAFNGLGGMVAEGSPVLWVLGVPIILFGHLLNIGLAIIAIFAHGVRLNMLEFSNNAGVQWAGYPYEPFSKRKSKES